MALEVAGAIRVDPSLGFGLGRLLQEAWGSSIPQEAVLSAFA